MLTALAAVFCHGGVTVPYLGSSSSGSPSAPCSGHVQQGRAHPAAGRPAGTQPTSEWVGEGFWGKKTPPQDRRLQHCSAVPAAQGELSVLLWEISPRFRLCEGVWAGYIRRFIPNPHWWLPKQSWARGSKPLGMNSPTCCVGLSSRQLRMSPLQHVSRPLLSTSLSSPAGSKTLGFSTTSSPNLSSLTPG